MIVFTPYAIIMLFAISNMIVYFLYLRKQHAQEDMRATYVFAMLWSIWTLFLLFMAPPAPGPSQIPPALPSSQTMFNIYMVFIMLPTLAVLLVVAIDLTILALKRR